MKKQLAFALTLTIVTLYSCHKDNSTTPARTGDSITINQNIAFSLTYVDTNDSLNKDQWELIINDPSGKLLLDTVARVNTTLAANIHANAYFVNLTYIFYSALQNMYAVTTYRNVNPRTWTALPNPDFYSNPVDSLPTSMATTYYTHPPNLGSYSDYSSLFISDYTLGNFFYGNYQPTDPDYQPGGLLTATYLRAGNTPVYMLFPQLGLYNFHTPPATGNDTVDLTHMETAAKASYSVPASYNLQNAFLTGYVDTTDLSRSMTLYLNTFNNQYPANATLQYPHTGVQAYGMFIAAGNPTTNEYLIYNSYQAQVPSSINWLTAANYTLHSSLQDSFYVTFSGAKPTLYNMEWQSGNNYFYIYSAPDGVPLHPYTWFTHLGSKLLQGQSIPSLTPEELYLQQTAGLPSDYNGLLNYYATPQTIKAPLGTAVTSYLIPL